jgi:hypothetical protein
MRDNSTTQIIGGTPAHTGDFPYMVLLMHFPFMQQRCNDKNFVKFTLLPF